MLRVHKVEGETKIVLDKNYPVIYNTSMTKRIPWSEEDLHFLKENYADIGAKECSIVLNRTVDAIYAVTKKYGIKGGKAWSKTDETYLIDNYHVSGPNHCAEKLGRSYLSIMKKARSLNLKSTTKNLWSGLEDNILREHYPTMGLKCSEFLTSRTDAAICKRASDLNISVLPIFRNTHKLSTHQGYEARLMELESEVWPIESYINQRTKIKHTCVENHEYYVAPNHVIFTDSGKSCIICNNKRGIDLTKPTTLYYIKITDNKKQSYYKIGITTRTVQKRMAMDKDKLIVTLFSKLYKEGITASRVERFILNKFKSSKANISGYLRSGGDSELFKEDIFGLDTEKAQ